MFLYFDLYFFFFYFPSLNDREDDFLLFTCKSFLLGNVIIVREHLSVTGDESLYGEHTVEAGLSLLFISNHVESGEYVKELSKAKQKGDRIPLRRGR